MGKGGEHEGEALTDELRKGSGQAAWAQLPERVRAAIRAGGIERFSEEHREVIRAYFRRLGEER